MMLGRNFRNADHTDASPRGRNGNCLRLRNLVGLPAHPVLTLVVLIDATENNGHYSELNLV
jgi:hypothetical protein